MTKEPKGSMRTIAVMTNGAERVNQAVYDLRGQGKTLFDGG